MVVLLILPQEVEIKWTTHNKNWYENKNYKYTNKNDVFNVNVEDLPLRTKVVVNIQCDYCNETFERKYGDWTISNEIKQTKKDACKKCVGKLKSESKIQYSYEDAVRIFSEDGYTLLISFNEYKFANDDLVCVCKNGHETKLSLTNFLLGRRCRLCRWEEKADSDRHSYEYVKQIFEKNGFMLLSETYSNNHEKLECICQCGNKTYMSFHSVFKGQKCKECKYRKVADANRTPYKEVEKYFKENGCILLSLTYENSDQKLHYVCSCGNENYITFDKFKTGQRCRECGLNKSSEKFRHDYESVEEMFKANGCELLSKNYINNSQKLEYKCKCGNIHNSTLANFLRISGCPNCGEKSIGEKVINDFLTMYNIKFTRQFTFENCRDKNPLPFDFALFENNKLKCLIEFDGEQHFYPIDFWGGEENFKYIKHHDDIKDNYCINNKIPLIRIPYWEFKNIEIIMSSILLNKPFESINNLDSFFIFGLS